MKSTTYFGVRLVISSLLALSGGVFDQGCEAARL